MAHYADELRLVDARAQYFSANHLGDGGYSARWVKFKVGPLRFHIPNTQARVAAVRFHDLPSSGHRLRYHVGRGRGDRRFGDRFRLRLPLRRVVAEPGGHDDRLASRCRESAACVHEGTT